MSIGYHAIKQSVYTKVSYETSETVSTKDK